MQEDCSSIKRLMSDVFNTLRQNGKNVGEIWERIKDIITKSILVVLP